MKKQTIERLREFIKKAEKLGKYPRNSATTMVAALNVVEAGLVDDEPDTPEYLTEHLEEIFNRQLQRLNLSEGSLQAYMTRVRRVVNDFQTYGQDPKMLLAWRPKIVQRSTKVRNGSSQIIEDMTRGSQDVLTSKTVTGSKNTNLRSLVWSLRPDLSIQIQLPSDLNKGDVVRLKKHLDLEAELTTAD